MTEKHAGGRPPHQPNDITIAEVKALSSLGLTQAMVADYIGISIKTLRKHYRDVIAKAKVGRLRQVAETAYDMAVSGSFPAMTMFYLKTQGHWRETDKVEEPVSDETVTKVEIEVVKTDDVKKAG